MAHVIGADRELEEEAIVVDPIFVEEAVFLCRLRDKVFRF